VRACHLDGVRGHGLWATAACGGGGPAHIVRHHTPNDAANGGARRIHHPLPRRRTAHAWAGHATCALDQGGAKLGKLASPSWSFGSVWPCSQRNCCEIAVLGHFVSALWMWFHLLRAQCCSASLQQMLCNNYAQSTTLHDAAGQHGKICTVPRADMHKLIEQRYIVGNTTTR
jgi:hypothetical protein